MLTVREDAPGRWTARDDDGRVLGRAAVRRRPDGRRWLFLRDEETAAYPALLAAIPGELSLSVGESSGEVSRALRGCGFVVRRTEHDYLVPVDPAVTGLGAAPVPEGVGFVDAGAAEVDRLRALDDLLRDDVPGTAGWRWDPEGFAAETFGPDFDPATYLIAVDGGSGDYVGLARVWWPPAGPRLGLIGVRRDRRRGGLAKALLAKVFAVVSERGWEHVTAEADTTNTASVTLLAGLGARRTGGSVELVRPAP